jgi:hypothetical protein
MTMHTNGWLEARIPTWDGPRPDLSEHEPFWEGIFYIEPLVDWDWDGVCQRAGGYERVAECRQVDLPPDISGGVRADYEADAHACAGVMPPEWALSSQFRQIP